METKIDFKKVRESLPHGAIGQIAKTANVSQNTVHLVLNGKSENIKVLDAIINYLSELKAKREATNSKLSALIK